jgi:O-antigen/teichoic acid export membrane protein
MTSTTAESSSLLSSPHAPLDHLDGRPSHVHNTGSRLAQNTVSNILGQAFIIGLTFFSTPYITRKLGASQYGALSLLMTYLFAFSLLNLGINTSLVKYLAELLPQNRLKEMQNYLSTSLTVLLGVGLLVGAAICFLAGPIARSCFKGPPELMESATVALRIASVAFVLQFLSQVMLAIPTALQRFEILNLVRAGSEVLRISGTVVLLWSGLGHGLPSLMVVMLLTGLCACVAYAFAARRLLPRLQFVPGFSRKHLSSLFKHSRYVVLASAGVQIVSIADTFLIGYFLPVASVAYYAVAYTLAQRIWTFVANVLSVVFPAASSFGGAGQPERIRELYLRGMKIGAAVACFPALALCIFSRPFLLHWLGHDYAQEGAWVLRLLALGFLINSFTCVPYQVLQSTCHADTAAKGVGVYTVINLTLFAILIPPFGILGASAGFLTSQLLFAPWFINIVNLLLDVSWGAMVRVAFLPVFICAGLAILGCSAFFTWVHSLFSLGVLIAFGLLAYSILAFRFVLDTQERTICKSLFGRILRKPSIPPAIPENCRS